MTMRKSLKRMRMVLASYERQYADLGEAIRIQKEKIQNLESRIKNGKPIKNPPVRFMACESKRHIKLMLKHHAKAIALCEKHNATFDLATSDVVVYVEHCTPALVDDLKLLYLTSGGNKQHCDFILRGDELCIS